MITGTQGNLCDAHVHSTFSPDARSTLSDMCERAIELGLEAVYFTEHLDLDPRDSGYRFFDPERYFSAIADARNRYGDLLEIGAGVEVCYQSHREEEIAHWLDAWPWDLVLGSVHIVDAYGDWVMIPDRVSMARWAHRRTADEAYRPYFEELLRAARSGLFDVLAHVDLVKRYGVEHYGPFDSHAFGDALDAVLEAAVETGTGLEVNTSGLYQPPCEPFPSAAILRRYQELGGHIITVGSDSHDHMQLGRGLADGYTCAGSAGFKAVARFRGRQPHLEPMPEVKTAEEASPCPGH